MASHPDRVRTAPLSEGYQFGDARHHGRIAIRFKRPFSITSPPVIQRDDWFTSNVIEGEHFAADAERAPVIDGFVVDRDCGDEG